MSSSLYTLAVWHGNAAVKKTSRFWQDL